MAPMGHLAVFLLPPPSLPPSSSPHSPDRLGSISALACPSPPLPPLPSAYRGSPGRKISPGLYPPPSRSLPGCTPGISARLDAHSVRAETRSCVAKTPPQTSALVPARWLAGSAGPALSVSPIAAPLHPAWVSLPAPRGLADTSRFRELPALPSSSPSGSQIGLSLPSHPPPPLLYSSLLASAQSACSLSRTPLPTLPRRIFRCLVPETPRRSAPGPQASPVSLVHQSHYP